MVTKKAAKNRLKIGELPFWNEFDTFDREINIEHKQIPKYIFKQMIRIIMAHTFCRGFSIYLC